MRLRGIAVLLLCFASAAQAQPSPVPCEGGVVFEDYNGNGRRDSGEPGMEGQRVSDGETIVLTDAEGRYRLPLRDRSSQFLIKPPGYRVARRDDSGLPDYWLNIALTDQTPLKYGGMPKSATVCRDYGLIANGRSSSTDGLRVLVFADPQTKSAVDVDYYLRDIVDPLSRQHSGGSAADLGLSLGDITSDDLSLYPQINAVTARLGVPWLHAPGNHDLDFDARRDEDSLLSYRHIYGPDTFAWEEMEASFVLLDDVIYRPGVKPEYIGGLREDQFAFLERYLASARKDRLLVIGVHIPFYDTSPDQETFRRADRERLFALLAPFPHVLLLSGHSHTQQQVFHDTRNGWQGAKPLHEFNVGAACGAFWSGVKDARGIPDSTMSDGTPNGYARLRIGRDGSYKLRWHSAESGIKADVMRLHAPRVLRRGAYPAWAVYANVYMARADSRVDYRIDDSEWKPMRRVEGADPNVRAENVRDDEADTLRDYDRAPEATPSRHLWRGALPTNLALGEHRIEVRYQDAWYGEQTAQTQYRLDDAKP